MVIETIITVWSMICAWLAIDATWHANSYGDALLPVFFQLIVWVAVVVPVALIGFYLKKRPSY